MGSLDEIERDPVVLTVDVDEQLVAFNRSDRADVATARRTFRSGAQPGAPSR